MKAQVYGRMLIYAALMLLVFLIARTAAAAHTPSPTQDPVFLQWAVPDTSQTTELQRENQRLRVKLARRTQQLVSSKRALHTAIHSPAYGNSWLERAFLCIHSYEGSWTDPNAPYWGGLQMDLSFMRTYAPWALAVFGTANYWPVSVQLATAIQAFYSGRGFHPWPNTARYCGLL